MRCQYEANGVRCEREATRVVDKAPQWRGFRFTPRYRCSLHAAPWLGCTA